MPKGQKRGYTLDQVVLQMRNYRKFLRQLEKLRKLKEVCKKRAKELGI